MSVTLINGLADLSRELGETTTKSTADRVAAYNDAVQEFFNEKKWPFARKKDSTLTTLADTLIYSIPMTDWREPGGIYKVVINGTTYTPIEKEDKEKAEYTSGNYFYLNELNTTITFMTQPTAGYTIDIYYYAVPVRQTDTVSGSFALLSDRYRKAVACLAAAFVYWNRHMNTDANNKFELYKLLSGNAGFNQSERTTNLPRSFGHYLKYRGYRRTYP